MLREHLRHISNMELYLYMKEDYQEIENDKLKEGVEVAALAALDTGGYFLYNSHQWAAIELPF